METNGTVPAQADQGSSASEQGIPNLGDILRNSPVLNQFSEGERGSLPKLDEDAPAPEDSTGNDDDVPQPDDERGNANDDDEGSEEGNGGEDSKDTQGGDLPTDDDIDWAYKVPVKVDGEVKYFTLEELRKGYATNQHLSGEGRKLGELRKQIEAERDEKLQEVIQLGSTLHAQMESAEKSLAAQYHDIKEKMEKAIEDGDGYEAKELKTQLTEVQKEYWAAREQKDALGKQVGEQVAKAQAEEQERQLAYFNEHIGTVLPKFDQKMAGDIRTFALKEGVPEGLLNQLFDPHVIKFINDYRVLKEKSTTGAEKRKAAPVAKQVPTRKGAPEKVRQQRQDQDLRARVFSGEADADSQMAFLKGLSKINSKLR